MSIDDDITALLSGSGFTYSWYDANDLVGVVTDNTDAASWAEKNGGTAAVADIGTPLFLEDAGDGLPALRFSLSPHDRMVVAGAFDGGGWDAGFTIFIVARKIIDGGPFLGNSSDTLLIGNLQEAQGFWWLKDGQTGDDVLPSMTNQTFALSSGSLGGQVYTEKGMTPYTRVGARALTGDFRIGEAFGTYTDAYIREVIVVKGKMTDSDTAAVFALLMTKWNRDTAPVFAYVGTSIENAGDKDMNDYVGQIDSPGLLRLGVGYNNGVDGQRYDPGYGGNLSGRFDSEVATHPGLKIIIMGAATNDLSNNGPPYNNSTADLCYGFVHDYAVHAYGTVSGLKIVGRTCLDRATFSGIDPDVEGVMLPRYNADVAAGSGVDWDVLSDVYADPTMGGNSAYSDTSLYADGTHPTKAGYLNLAAIDAVAVNALLDSLLIVLPTASNWRTNTAGNYVEADINPTDCTFTVGGAVTVHGSITGDVRFSDNGISGTTLILSGIEDPPLQYGDVITISLDAGAIVNGSVPSDAIVDASVTNNVPIPPPSSAPVIVGVAGRGEVLLQWDEVAYAATYTIYQDGVSIGSTGGTSYTVTGLTNGTAYSFTVTAVNDSAESAPSNAKVLTPSTNPGSGGGNGGSVAGGGIRRRY